MKVFPPYFSRLHRIAWYCGTLVRHDGIPVLATFMVPSFWIKAMHDQRIGWVLHNFCVDSRIGSRVRSIILMSQPIQIPGLVVM